MYCIHGRPAPRSLVVRILAAVMISLAVACCPAAAATEQRIALIIGNAKYETGGTLANPVNDARLIRSTLERLNFDIVYREDATKAEMEKAIQQFTDRLAKAGSQGVGLVYYAGHGMQSGGENYLLPVDIRLSREADLRFYGVRAGDVLAQMDSTNAPVKIVILDACRDNPFANSFGAGMPKGLSEISLGNTEFFVVYAATAGNVAMDGRGANSPFALALASRLGTPNSDLSDTFRLVTNDVSIATGNNQLPEARTTMRRQFTFAGQLIARNEAPLEMPDVAPLTAAPTASMLYGKWCDASRGASTALAVDASSITYFVGGQKQSFAVHGIVPAADGRLQLEWDNRGTPTYLEFGEFAVGGQTMTQVRGRQGSNGSWIDHYKRFRRCN